MTETCSDCDFIGPLWPVTQQSTELHRAWHNVARAGTYAFRELQALFARVAEASRNTAKSSYALAPAPDPTSEEPMNEPAVPPEIWRVEPHDDVTLTRGGGIISGRVTRVQLGARGTILYLYGRGLPYLVNIDPANWTLIEHRPAIPTTLRVGARYHVMTINEVHFQAYWSPVDGIRANHPWLHPDGQTRTRQGAVVRARLAENEGPDQ